MEAHNSRRQALAVLDNLLAMYGLEFEELPERDPLVDSGTIVSESGERNNSGSNAVVVRDGKTNDPPSTSREIPDVDQYTAAFQSLDGITPKSIELLRLHYHAPDRTITARQLAQAIGWKDGSPDAVNLHYGTLAAQLGAQLRWIPKLRSEVLATFQQGQGDLEWIMRPQVAEALERLGWV